jgi:ABC-type polysaccharide/polyol phosphate export systems, permease component
MTNTSESRDSADGLPPLLSVGRPRGLLTGTRAAAVELYRSRELVRRLIAKEIKSRYKDSYLGVVWSLFRPIIQLAIYYVFIGHFLGAARAIPDFAIFIFAGLTAWTFFNEVVSGGTASIFANAGLVKKIYLPREIFPITSLGAGLFNFAIQFAVLTAATVLFGVFPLHWAIFYVIPAVLILAVYGLALGMLLGAINVYLRDTEHLVEIALMLMFWASPILYSLSFVNGAIGGTVLEPIYLANPVTTAIVSMQKAMWIAGSQDPAQFWPADLDLRLAVTLAVGFVFLWFAQRMFSRLQGNFAQEM